jgi:ferredoxin
MKVYVLSQKKWIDLLNEIIAHCQVYAPLKKENSVDFIKVTAENSDTIYYDGNTPVTPLKAFFTPVKENVVNLKEPQQRVVIGVPNCDLAALDLMDNIYINEDYIDPCYKQNRERTIIFGKDCFQYKDTCHCTVYGIKPFIEKNCDIAMSVFEENFYLIPMNERGEEFLKKQKIDFGDPKDSLPEKLREQRDKVVDKLQEQNRELPDEKETRKGIEKSEEKLWKDYAATCVSCGACSFICPTCHCFLLIDRDNFEKVKNWDVCQFPGFARVAAGEDPLKPLHERFKYRYLCKYIYKPDMFKAIACTGCGRCIDTCIGKIDKNEVIKEACKQG